MIIKKIETFTSKDKRVAITKVTTDDGKVGYGQLPTYYADVSSFVLHRQVGKYFLNQDIDNVDKLIYEAIEGEHKFIGSYICRAISGIETAILDLKAKSEHKTVCELLGGEIKDIDVYGSSMRRDITPKDEADRIKRLKDEKGFKAFKIRIGSEFGHDKDAWEGRTNEIVPTVREAISYDTDLIVDANSCYTPQKAIEIGKMLEQNGVFHYEEPCPHMELEWTKQVTDSLNIDIAGGEQDNIMPTWKMMIKMKAVDIVQPDILYIGGMHRALEVCNIAKANNLICTPHAANHSLVTVFTMHLLGVVENRGKYMEFSIENCEWLKNIFEPKLEVIDGKVRIPSGEGWGVRINDSWLENATYAVSEA